MEDVHVAALIEGFRGQFKVFGEALQAQNDKLDQLDAKVDGIAADVAGLKVDMADVRDRLTRVERGVNGKTRRKTTKRS
jgi:hypothetical protein